MRTESDLRTALRSLEREAPSPETVLPDPDHAPHRRRPAILIAAAVTATAAIATAVPTYLARTDTPTTPAASPTPTKATTPTKSTNAVRPAVQKWRYVYRLNLPQGWTILYRDFTNAGQSVAMEVADGRRCDVRFYEPGRFDTDRIGEPRTPVTLNGRTGFLAPVAGVEVTDPTTGEIVSRNGKAVVWEYAPDAWAMATCDTDGLHQSESAANMIAAARATVGTPEPVLLPFRVTKLPAGLTATTLIHEGPDFAGAPQMDIELDFGALSDGPFISALFTKGRLADPGPVRTSIDGHPATLSDDGVTTIVAFVKGYEIRIQGHPASAVKQVAAAIKLADPADESTWFNGETAIPQ